MKHIGSTSAPTGVRLTLPQATAARAASGPVTLSREALLTALLGEIDAMAALVVVSASLANALRQLADAPIKRSSFATYLPQDPVLYSSSAGDMLRAGVDADILVALQMFIARLSLAKRLSETVAAGHPDQPISLAERDTLADSWQRACGSAIAAAQMLRQSIIEASRGRAQPRAGRMSDLLKAGQRGEHPCVLSDGSIIVPGWAERRRCRRQTLELDCVIHRADRKAMGRIYDLSTGGLGLTGLTDVTRGESVTVELATGRRLVGKVSWSSGERAGIKFDLPLAIDDDLLPPPIV